MPRHMRYTGSMKKKEKYQHPANPERAAAMHGLASSNASGSHDNRPKRERSRAAIKRAEIRRDAGYRRPRGHGITVP